MKILYLPQEEIDKKQWDLCIATASNGLIYGYSFYLDALGKNWDALIADDYSLVMPLTWNRKFGFYYLYQPFFAASLGIFGNNISAEIVKQFLEHIPSKFKYWDFYLNRNNVFAIPAYDLYERRNYILNLKEDYETLKSNYSKSHIRNISRAAKTGNVLEKNIPLNDVITLAKEQSKNFSPASDQDYENFSKLFSILSAKNQAITYGVYSSQRQLVASCVYFFSHSRAYYILVGNHPNGRTSGASHLMIDQFIREHAGENLLLDFEGSDIKNLAWFYSSFGATQEKYVAIRLNRLPAVAKLFKQ
ncbi:MAG: hypothetical protein ABI683_01295 [Ginsengibacter sp.]